MDLKQTDSPLAVFLSGALILGSVAFFILWALQSAYPYS